MELTGQEIEDIVYAKIKSLSLDISGNVYERGTRPLSSDKEDCVVSFLTGTADQVQIGEVVVNIYVPDILLGDGMYYKNTARCKELELLLVGLTPELNRDSHFVFTKSGMICTLEEKDIKQHFVSVKFRFKYLNENY